MACRPRLSWHVAGCGQTRTDRTVGEPDSEVVEWCSPFEIEQESRDRTLTWGDLDVSLRGDQNGDVCLESWGVKGPKTPPGVVAPYGVVSDVDS